MGVRIGVGKKIGKHGYVGVSKSIGGKREKSSKKTSKPFKPNWKVIGIIVLVLLVIFAVMKITGNEPADTADTIKATELSWAYPDMTFTTKDTQTLMLGVKSDVKADKIAPSDFEIIVSDKSVCSVKYDSANYAQALFEVTPLKDGKTDILVKCKGYTSDKATVTVKFEKEESSTVEVTTTTAAQTTAANQQQVMVYVAPSGDKYHKKSCRFYTEDCTEMTLEQAEQAGYEPCGVCF